MEQYNFDSFHLGPSVIDSEGYRLNVGIIVAKSSGQLLWAHRICGDDAWQFPQGGIRFGETNVDALFRELNEELGLKSTDVRIIGSTSGWLRYEFPLNLIREDSHPICIGQKQCWFLLQLLADESSICLNGSDEPEFDRFCWVDYWYPISQVVQFKKAVYRQALKMLEEPLNLALGENYD